MLGAGFYFFVMTCFEHRNQRRGLANLIFNLINNKILKQDLSARAIVAINWFLEIIASDMIPLVII